MPYTAADEAEYLAMIADLDAAQSEYDARLEERAERAAQMDRLSSGVPLF